MKYVIRLGHKRLLLSYFILFSLYNIEFNDSLQMCLRKIKATIQKYSKAYIVYIYISFNFSKCGLGSMIIYAMRVKYAYYIYIYIYILLKV